MIKKEKEIWRTYPDYPFIEASSLGRIRTKDRYVPGKNGSKRLTRRRRYIQTPIKKKLASRN